MKCNKCEGQVVMARIGTVPETLSVVGVTTLGITPVEAHVCVECGYITLYATEPRELRADRQLNAEQRQK